MHAVIALLLKLVAAVPGLSLKMGEGVLGLTRLTVITDDSCEASHDFGCE